MVNYYVDDLVKNNVNKDNIVYELGFSGSIDKSEIKYKLDGRDGMFWMGFPVKKNRPNLWDWLFNKVQRKLVKKHLVTKWDRWARDVILALGLKNYCEFKDCVVEATQDSNDERVMPIILVLAEDEGKQTKKRVSSGKKWKFDHGLYLGTERLYGYKKSKVNIKGIEYLHLVPNNSEKQMILEIFSSTNYKLVCKKYQISTTIYYNILRNKFYCGFIKYKGKEKKGIHTPLVSEERWELSQ